jgi:hypothetical protein
MCLPDGQSIRQFETLIDINKRCICSGEENGDYWANLAVIRREGSHKNAESRILFA